MDGGNNNEWAVKRGSEHTDLQGRGYSSFQMPITSWWRYK